MFVKYYTCTVVNLNNFSPISLKFNFYVKKKLVSRSGSFRKTFFEKKVLHSKKLQKLV